jgi:hypothetical protein
MLHIQILAMYIYVHRKYCLCIYIYCFKPLFMGKTKEKFFRVTEDFNSNLLQTAKLTGFSQTQILEDALSEYLGISTPGLKMRGEVVRSAFREASGPAYQPKPKAALPIGRIDALADAALVDSASQLRAPVAAPKSPVKKKASQTASK